MQRSMTNSSFSRWAVAIRDASATIVGENRAVLSLFIPANPSIVKPCLAGMIKGS